MKRATFGILLILLGTVLLLELFEVLTLPSWNELWSYWPFILVALGLFFLLQGDTGVFTFFLILIGTLFSLRRFHVYPFTNEAVIWPSIIISAGISFILSGSFSAASGRRSYCESPRTSEPGEQTRKNQRSIDFLDESVFLSGKNFAVSSLNFRGGELSVVLGGMEVDLRNIKLTESATLFLRCTLGGIDLFLPPELPVVVRGQEILGGADVRVHPLSSMEEPVLTIDYHVVLGGIDVVQ
ncbi:MAG: cell wall-active antibiotics response protein [Tissierellia bacterium]|nr:DUF5668 domain-containing protein [Bacillota bacterium]NLL23098.1 cell wall-active antibiotics response protein [Tissierellia bacterium]